MNSNAKTVRACLIARLERYAANARKFADARKPLPPLDKNLLFMALADAGDFNRAHPEIAIPPLDPRTGKVQEPRLGAPDADTDAADRWRTA